MHVLDRLKKTCFEVIPEQTRQDAARNFMCSYAINAFTLTNAHPVIPLVGGTLAASTEIVRQVTYAPFVNLFQAKLPKEQAFGVLLHAAFIYAVMGSLSAHLTGFKLSILATVMWSTKVSIFAGMPVNLFIAESLT